MKNRSGTAPLSPSTGKTLDKDGFGQNRSTKVQNKTKRQSVREEGGTWGICTRRAGKLVRARSRLYRSEILQEYMRLKALAEIYIMDSFAQL